MVALPDKSTTWDEAFLKWLKPWVENGGTLIATGRSAFAPVNAKSGLTKVRLLRDVRTGAKGMSSVE